MRWVQIKESKEIRYFKILILNQPIYINIWVEFKHMLINLKKKHHILIQVFLFESEKFWTKKMI